MISNIDLGRIADFHRSQKALATLAVQERRSARQLLFDEDGWLCGGRFEKEGRTELARQAEPLHPLAFCGVHVISPRMLQMMTGERVFSIIEAYLRLASEGEKIVGFRADGAYWRDLGTLESLKQAEHDIQSGIFTN